MDWLAGPRARARLSAWLGVLLVAIVAVVGACGPAASSTASPGAAATGSSSPGPKPTIWPTLTVEAVVALGAANSEFAKMSDDLATAIESQDPARLRTAIGDALTFLQGNQENIAHLQDYDATKSVGDRLATAYGEMIDGVTQVRDGLAAGDADAVQGGFATFFKGSNDYAAVSPDLADITEQAILMKRILLK